MSTEIDIERFARHIVLREVGGPGQQALGRARVTIIGAGGLGAPASLYLAAAGVGQITLIDPDTVSLDNLQRQILFRTDDVGQSKVETGAAALQALNPGTQVKPVQTMLDAGNASELLAGADLVLDGCDNFETRFAVNAASRALGMPLISGALGRWDGQVSLFNASPDAPCYRCWVPQIPPDAETCARMGVVGALTGVIGSIMALEAIKHICSAGETLDGRILLFDGLTMDSRTVKLRRDPDCPGCGTV
ncbi:molybdopterin-synthase adenylyltransferase MoeB [uncultured Maricaulis sp.]|uniref:HesA/MoeB/ThiF family protein n=1 Tax=uncultured Maricaulis sp. TaxID=174710 RepID=UPI0030D92709|tara:strand:+ start:95380 stop:96126 length:747 start_codon:yes stop_codon:yes gene_type:complete